jgi:hypothetical protein
MIGVTGGLTPSQHAVIAAAVGYLLSDAILLGATVPAGTGQSAAGALAVPGPRRTRRSPAGPPMRR